MYYLIVTTLMFLFPVLSVLIDALVSPVSGGWILLIGKWYVFWAMGVRLLLAGLRQIAQPAYTAREILGLKVRPSDPALLLVRELGFANFALGVLGVASLFISEWRLAAALTGGIFYACTGVNHVFQPQRNRLENIAMISDMFAAAVLLGVITIISA